MKKLNNFFFYTFPRTVILISVVHPKNKGNICTVAWHTPVSHNPPLYGIAISPNRLTYKLIKQGKNFVINFLDINYMQKIHLVGRKSGRNFDKSKLFNLEKSYKIKSPTISESYASFECKLVKEIIVGDHNLFIGKILRIRIKKNAFKNRMIKCKPTFFFGRDLNGNEFYCSIGKRYKARA